MSLIFPRFREFAPVHDLFNELRAADQLSRQLFSADYPTRRSFTPRFDVKETPEAYELQGELPGIEQNNISVEWSDEKTLTISGKSEVRNEYTNTGEVTETTEGSEVAATEATIETESTGNESYKKPTVEDEDGEGAATSEEAQLSTVGKTEDSNAVAQKNENGQKYWVTERSFGSFHRTFQFPHLVDHDNVSANLKNGVLSVTIPKAAPKPPKKITIA